MGNQKENFIGLKDVQNILALLLFKIQNLQDPTITCSSWIQDPQHLANLFLSDIQYSLGPTAILPWQDPISLRPHEKKKIQNPSSCKATDPGFWGSMYSNRFGILAACICRKRFPFSFHILTAMTAQSVVIYRHQDAAKKYDHALDGHCCLDMKSKGKPPASSARSHNPEHPTSPPDVNHLRCSELCWRRDQGRCLLGRVRFRVPRLPRAATIHTSLSHPLSPRPSGLSKL